MEVLQDSYKDTEIGRIPKDWQVKRFGEVFDFIKTASHSKNQMTYEETESQIYNVHYGAIHTTYREQILNFDKYNVPKITDDSSMPRMDQFLQDGDLVIVDASEDWGGMGECVELKNIGDKKVIGGLHTYAVRDNKGFFTKGFAGYIFQNTKVRHRLASYANVSKVYGITKGNISIVPLVIPPLPEQQKIAEILSTVDEQISATERIIEKSKELKKGLMQKLFSEGIGHTEFKDTKIGRIPKEWEVVRVGDICKLQGGYAFKSKDAQESGVRWLKIANVGFNRVKWEDESFLPLGFERNHSEYVLNEGDIVVAMTRPVLNGKLKICKIESKDSGVLLNQRVGRVRLMDNQDADYFFQCFNTKRFVDAVEGELFGTDPPNISSKMFENIRIPLPPKEERKKISEILYAIDNNIKCEEKFKSELEQLKIGLMQQLLTGQKRVKV